MSLELDRLHLIVGRHTVSNNRGKFGAKHVHYFSCRPLQLITEGALRSLRQLKSLQRGSNKNIPSFLQTTMPIFQLIAFACLGPLNASGFDFLCIVRWPTHDFFLVPSPPNFVTALQFRPNSRTPAILFSAIMCGKLSPEKFSLLWHQFLSKILMVRTFS